MKINFNNKLFFIALLTGFIFLLSGKSAYAYLEPGTSSFLMQIVAAAIISSLFMIRKISAFFAGIFKTEKRENLKDKQNGEDFKPAVEGEKSEK